MDAKYNNLEELYTYMAKLAINKWRGNIKSAPYIDEMHKIKQSPIINNKIITGISSYIDYVDATYLGLDVEPFIILGQGTVVMLTKHKLIMLSPHLDDIKKEELDKLMGGVKYLVDTYGMIYSLINEVEIHAYSTNKKESKIFKISLDK